jgi:hypothetical protein
MQEQIITFETAKLVKEKGFNIPVIKYYTPKGYCSESEGYRTERLEESNWNNGMGSYPTLSKDVCCSAPTQSLLQKWLREVHKIDVFCDCIGSGKYYSVIYDNSIKEGNDKVFEQEKETSYEEALEVGLLEALKLI